MTTLQIKQIALTPELASKFLLKNTCNRRVRQPYVEQYARAMLAGEWRLTHQGLAFDSDGNLQDGQHRCMAVIASGVSIPTVVVHNMPIENYRVIDSSVARNLTDHLRINTRLVDMSAFIGTFHTTTKQTTGALEAYVRKFLPLSEELLKACGAAKRMLSTVPVRAGALVAMAGGDRAYVLAQYRAFVLSDYDNMAPATKVLYRQIIEGNIQTGGSQQRITFLKAHFVFSSQNKNAQRVNFKNQDARVALVRDIITDWMTTK
jgi:hypothetical protein